MLRITTPSQRAFDSLEIRKSIFKSLASEDKRDLVACAQVCSTWSPMALNELWRELSSIRPVLELLGIYYEEDIQERLRRKSMTTIYDWRRLRKYSGRVKRLALSEDDAILFDGPNECLLDEIITRKSTILLPNLEELDLSFENARYLRQLPLLFLGKKLTRLSIGFPSNPGFEIDFPDFITNVKRYCQGLTSFTIRGGMGLYPGAARFEKVLIRLFARLKKLKVVAFPLYALPPSMFDVLSELPDLTSISSKDAGYSGVYDIPFTVDKLRPNAFKSLTTLEISAQFGNIVNFFVENDFASRLLHLKVHPLYFESSKSLRSFLEDIARHCPELRTLGVMGINPQFRVNSSSRIRLISDCIAWRRVTQHTLHPLIRLTRLTSFTIAWPSPIEITNADLTSLTKKIASLEELNLNCCPLVHGDSLVCNLDFMALPQMAEHCPNIQRLSLFIGSGGVPIGPYTRPILPLVNLRSLNLGLTHVPRDDKTLTTFLSKVCPSTCTFPARTQDVQPFRELKLDRRWMGSCTEIGEVVSHLAKAREEEREISGRIIWEWQVHSQCLEKKYDEEKTRAKAKADELQRKIDELEARIAKGSSLRPKAGSTPAPRRSLRRKSTI